MRLSHQLLVMACIAAGAWLVLESLRPKADWVRLECPPVAIPGQAFPVHATFDPPIPPGFLTIDLHARQPSRQGSSVVAVSQSRLTATQSEFNVEIPVRTGTTATVVRAVLYWSPTGSWKDRERSAISADIPVRAPAAAAAQANVRKQDLPVFNLADSPEVPRSRPLPVRFLIASLWCATAIIALTRRPLRSSSTSPAAMAPAAPWLGPAVFGLGACIAALAEATDLSQWLSEIARSMARQFSAYDAREPGQQLVTSLLIAGAVPVMAALVRSRLPGCLRVAWTAMAMSLVLICLDSLSLHAFDEIAESTGWGVPLIQFANLACALTATIAIGIARVRTGSR